MNCDKIPWGHKAEKQNLNSYQKEIRKPTKLKGGKTGETVFKSMTSGTFFPELPGWETSQVCRAPQPRKRKGVGDRVLHPHPPPLHPAEKSLEPRDKRGSGKPPPGHFSSMFFMKPSRLVCFEKFFLKYRNLPFFLS